jgi:uncharacterized repeat protein (TIGR01451 family)
MNTLSRLLFRLTPVLLASSMAFAQPRFAVVPRALMLQPTKYRLRAGEAIKLETAAETRDFLLKAKVRRASVPGFTRPGLVVAPNVAGDEILLGASLAMKPGLYAVNVSAVADTGEERIATLEVVVEAIPTVPSTATRPPVVLLNGWQKPSLTGGTCPVSSDPSSTFGNLSQYLIEDGVPVVYFFDNCTACQNCTIEALGAQLGDVLNQITYDNGTLVPQIDLVAHSMGGLIIRSYLSGKQNAPGQFSPPSNPRVRKAVFIATPHFGSYEADSTWARIFFAFGNQTNEMKPGSRFLWDLATWNQGGDDLRGVDALAIIGNAGTWYDEPNPGAGVANASDGVVSLTSASLSFVEPDERTRVVDNYCHIPVSPGFVADYLACTGPGIANIGLRSDPTCEAIESFLGLSDPNNWQNIGKRPSQNWYGGVYFAVGQATGPYLNNLSKPFFGSVALEDGGATDMSVFYSEFLSGTDTFAATSASLGQVFHYGPITVPSGQYSVNRAKFGPAIAVKGVGPLASNTAGWVVPSGTAITISGGGFGDFCSSCQVLAGGTPLQVLSWSDRTITATLPAYSGLVQLQVQTAASGSDWINIMTAPLAAPTLSVSKTHSGAFTQGQFGATYTVMVSNTASAGATSGTLTVTDTVPTGLTLVTMAGGGWNCSSNTCTRSDVLNPGFVYPPITVTVNVAANAPPQVTNQVSVSGGGSATAKASDVTTIVAVPLAAPVLTFPAPALTWNASVGAASYDVHFGTSSAPPFVTNTTATSYAPGTLNSGTTYYWQVVARNASGSAPSAIWAFTTGAPAVGLRFLPVTPCRVADTRGGAGPFGGPTIAGGSSRSFAIPQSACGIPATALAYSLNVTVVPEGHLSYLSLWPTGQSQPLVSTLNSFGGDVVANAAIVPAGAGGAVSVYVTDPTDVILDINGYFDASASGSAFSFYPATPCRVADTRGGAGTFGGPTMLGGTPRDFPVPLSPCGIPATAGGYSLNVTVVPAGYLGYLSTWPTGQAQPNVSTLNSWKGKVVANAAIVPTGTNESISVFVSNPTDVILDINGYFGQPGHAGALSFYSVAPCRVADTRNPNGPFGGPEMGMGNTSTRSFIIPASGCNIPSTAAAYSLNATVVPDGALSYLSTWPTGSSQPLVSTLNSFDGSVVANAAIVPAGTSGAISVYVTNPTHVILDINGYFAP